MPLIMKLQQSVVIFAIALAWQTYVTLNFRFKISTETRIASKVHTDGLRCAQIPCPNFRCCEFCFVPAANCRHSGTDTHTHTECEDRTKHHQAPAPALLFFLFLFFCFASASTSAFSSHFIHFEYAPDLFLLS